MRVKICGLTRSDEAVACLQAGADLIGLNFHFSSPRFVDFSRARQIVSATGRPAQVVGLFVNTPAEQIALIAEELGLLWVQLHGEESPEDLRVLDRFQIIRAFRIGSTAHIVEMSRYLDQCQAAGRLPDAVLVDAFVPGQAGGTATVVSEDILAQVPRFQRLIIAGGLTPENVASRVERSRPWMVDVASGVESSPGRKDLTKVTAFIQAARGTSRG